MHAYMSISIVKQLWPYGQLWAVLILKLIKYFNETVPFFLLLAIRKPGGDVFFGKKIFSFYFWWKKYILFSMLVKKNILFSILVKKNLFQWFPHTLQCKYGKKIGYRAKREKNYAIAQSVKKILWFKNWRNFFFSIQKPPPAWFANGRPLIIMFFPERELYGSRNAHK